MYWSRKAVTGQFDGFIISKPKNCDERFAGLMYWNGKAVTERFAGLMYWNRKSVAGRLIEYNVKPKAKNIV